jgi:septal ring factor EnvC (AmiA/AmiB activator)
MYVTLQQYKWSTFLNLLLIYLLIKPSLGFPFVSQANEIQDKAKDVEVQEESVASLTERTVKKEKEILNLASKNKEKDTVISDMKKRVHEKQSTIEELSDSLTGKDKQLKSFQSRYVMFFKLNLMSMPMQVYLTRMVIFSGTSYTPPPHSFLPYSRTDTIYQ